MAFGTVFILVLLPVTAVLSQDIKCNVTIDITMGVKEGTSIIFDGITYDESNYFVSGNEIKGCICNVKKCIRKCCREGEVLNVTSRSCESATNSAISVDTYHIINVPDNQICDEGESRVKAVNFSVEDGILVWDEDRYYLDDFCVDDVEDSRVALLCVEGEQEVNGLILSIGMIISMPFLLLTFLVYAILPESNLHRKALMNYVMTLFLAYVFLVTVQLYPGRFEAPVCEILGYLIIFFFLASFVWMNVMCLDMWFAFSGMRGFNGQRMAERKRFIYYCVYAFGVPCVHILVVFLLNQYGDPEKSVHYPGIGKEKCFLRDGYPNLWYFYGPMALLITINIILFILTAVKIQKVKKETSMLKHSDSKKHNFEDDKQKFNLYVKLLFAMGINWTMEIISWACLWLLSRERVPQYVWYLTDFCNALYGVFIFFIFVFKRKIWKSLKKRYYLFMGKPYFAQTMSVTTHTTRTSNYSTSETGPADLRLSEYKNSRGEERTLTGN